VTINWGDAAANAPADTSAGTVVVDGSGFDIQATHTYASAGAYSIFVTIQSSAGDSLNINSTAIVELAAN
jgi:hypothetical protein